jgi:hypothetical protein
MTMFGKHIFRRNVYENEHLRYHFCENVWNTNIFSENFHKNEHFCETKFCEFSRNFVKFSLLAKIRKAIFVSALLGPRGTNIKDDDFFDAQFCMETTNRFT